MELTKYEKEFYEQRIKYLRHQIKQVEKDIFLTKENKKMKIAYYNQQIELLKKDFIKRLSRKDKYNRTHKKIEDKKKIEEELER